MTRPISKSLVFVLAVISLTGCESSTCPTAGDPDHGPVTARFTMNEIVYGDEYETDIILFEHKVVFAASERYDSYEWHVEGSDTVLTDSAVTYKFSIRELPNFATIDVTLIAKREPDGECNPNDDGVDTLTKTLTCVLRWDSKILGSFFGSNASDPLDSFVVEIYYRDESYLVMTNINRGCIDTTGKYFHRIDKWLGGTMLRFDAEGLYDTTNCRNPIGLARVNDNHILVEYEYDHERIPEVFSGYRINP